MGAHITHYTEDIQKGIEIMYYSTRNRRRLTFESLMAMPSEPESNAFYTYVDGDDRVEVLNDTFTLVLSRDVRKNTRIAAEIAFQIANQRPEDDVLYVNTYAGVALMKEAFTKALEKSGLTQDEPNSRLEPSSEIDCDGDDEKSAEIPTPFQGEWQGGEEDEEIDNEEIDNEEAGDDDDEWIDPEDDSDDEYYGQEPSILPNLFIHDVPFGTWDTDRLERDIEDRGRKRNHTIIVLNSFEFASMGREEKSRMAKGLLELRMKLGLSIVVFSHDLKRDLAAGLPGRGPLGIIAANSGSVQRLNDPFEHLIRHRKKEMARASSSQNPSKQSENAVIHEAQMRGWNLRKPWPYMRIPNFPNDYERDRWFREQKELPDYYVDPWVGTTEKYGRELLFLARSPILKRYFEQHAEYIFTKGEEPTEYELITDTYEAKEVEKKWLI